MGRSGVASEETVTAMPQRTSPDDAEIAHRLQQKQKAPALSRRSSALIVHRVFQPDLARAAAALVLLAGARPVRPSGAVAGTRDRAISDAGQERVDDGAPAIGDVTPNPPKEPALVDRTGGEGGQGSRRVPVGGEPTRGAAGIIASRDR